MEQHGLTHGPEKKYEGGQNVTVAAPMDIIPVFVREGADTEHLLNIFSE